MKSYKLTRSFFTLLLIMSSNCGISTIDNREKLYHSLDLFRSETFDTDPFFNTHFLSHYDLVARILIKEEGFEEIFFKSADGIQLNGLFRKIPNAPYSMVFCAGFYPGRKEGLASFIKLIPKNTNILFFDARGHGKSEGRFLTNLHNYGVDEYKDIIGALQFLKKETSIPIFIHGICAGAFHAANALSHIDCQEYNILGFIFDSGLPSLLTACYVPEKHFKEKIIPGLFLALYSNDTKLEVKERYVCKLCCSITSLTLKMITSFIKPYLEKNHEQINLTHKISNIKCPILYIHAYDDTYAPITSVVSLSENTLQKTCWWVNSSEHALNHIKHKNDYQRKLDAFLSTSIHA